jgi:hypothetical protein
MSCLFPLLLALASLRFVSPWPFLFSVGRHETGAHGVELWRTHSKSDELCDSGGATWGNTPPENLAFSQPPIAAGPQPRNIHIRNIPQTSDLKTHGYGYGYGSIVVAQVLDPKVARYAATVLEACAYCGSGDVLKVQQMLAACGEHPDPESEAFQAEGDAHQVASLCPDPHSNPGGVS